MGLKLVTAPADNPVTLAQAKAHLREDSDDFNDQIEAFIDAATAYADGPMGFLGRALIDQTWDLYLDAFPAVSVVGTRNVYAIEIPLPPLIEVVDVFYLDSNGVEQTFDAASYTVDDSSEPARIVLGSTGSWPTIQEAANAVRVRFRAGYLDQGVSPAVESVPGTIKAAILIMVGDLYQNRESSVIGQTVTKIPWSAEALLRRHRIYLSLA